MSIVFIIRYYITEYFKKYREALNRSSEDSSKDEGRLEFDRGSELEGFDRLIERIGYFDYYYLEGFLDFFNFGKAFKIINRAFENSASKGYLIII